MNESGAWGEFELENELGRGATARVHLAVRKSDRKRVALKIFHPAFWDQEKLRRRAFGEFRAISSLKHPNIVQILDACWEYDPPGVVLEYVDGASLEKFQPRIPYILPEVSALIVIEVLKALEHAHEEGVIHRDLKPENILIGNDGRVVVSDFGMAKMSDMSRLTLSGTVLGSPDYMSPEQARGDFASAQSDLFSAAAVFYFLITGTRPFARHTPLATLAAVCNVELEPAQRRNPKVSTELARILERGLAKDPKQRYSTATEFRLSLEKYLKNLGLTDEQFTFAQWVAAPNDFAMDALRTISETLGFSAEKNIKNRAWDQTLENLSHLSLVAPEGAALVRLTQDFKRAKKAAQRQRMIVPLLILSFISIGTVAGVAWKARLSPQDMSSGQVKVLVPEEKSMAKPLSPLVETPKVVRREKSNVTQAKLALSAVKKQIPKNYVRLKIPQNVQVFWDGVPIDPRRPFLQKVGSHLLRLERPGAEPIEQEIIVDEKEPTIIQVH